MTSRRHLLIVDPTPFAGGSKTATENMLRLLDKEGTRITVLSADRESWSWVRVRKLRLFEPTWLAQREQGPLYVARHAVIAMQILLLRLLCGRIDLVLGASGPGVDLAIYLTKPLLRYKIVQLIHGPVAYSRIIGRCLASADQVHYLESCRQSVLAALSKTNTTTVQLEAPRFQNFRNGISAHQWPAACQYDRPVIFWAASLLKWKGLETLLDALRSIPDDRRPETHICYIRPKSTSLPVSEAPLSLSSVYWHESPGKLDALRAGANIFVSTSTREPFGLSILEAMAAGHCIVIPADGAFWDKVLDDGIDCIKYQPGNAQDLATKLDLLSRNLSCVTSTGRNAARRAEDYRADLCYAAIKTTIENIADKPIPTNKSRAETEVGQ